MNKYKVLIGACGPTPITSGVITAHDKREALIKYYESIGEEYSEEKVEKELKYVYEHIPKSRVK